MNHDNLTDEEKLRLEQEMKANVLSHMSDEKEILEYLDFTLKNFSYRYLESETTGELSVKWSMEEDQTSGKLEVIAYEEKLAQSLKTQNDQTRKGIIEMAKSFKKTDAPKVKYILGISFSDLSHDDLKLKAYAEVNWAFPNYEEHEDYMKKRNRKELLFEYKDSFEMRNNFPRELEEVCTIL